MVKRRLNSDEICTLLSGRRISSCEVNCHGITLEVEYGTEIVNVEITASVAMSEEGLLVVKEIK